MALEMKSVGAVIVAAGRGERAGDPGNGPKQYRDVAGRPVLSWTLERFASHPAIGPIVVVIHPDDEALFATAVARLPVSDRFRTVFGDRTRQMSVRRGLEALAAHAPSHVLIHDGVRPFVDVAMIDRVLMGLRDGGDAILPAQAVNDTLKAATIGRRVIRTVSRENLYAAQTPQGFAFAPILEAHRRAAVSADDGFTDDASIAEWADMVVRIVDGSTDNLKITLREDLAIADRKMHRLNGMEKPVLPDVRTGNGYDVHALVPGSQVTLCGVAIDHDKTLSGHSDADVGYHALTDALLATCGAGDIGDHFPPTDEKWRGAASRIFLSSARDIVTKAGGTIMNADVTLICEAPRIGPHRSAMRAAMARDLQISLARCSVKATTNERIGFVGREEGIAAIATATVVYSEIDR
ncbi:bifunctional 2-C-methyl-D-erythritol 4-phosphate cytidylyltransferase/2-C-methyl-D-erythritol 2,4-cyclodiphosphate synthase [Pararhizobium haloflavum]|uniref:bifunctional 2-C-methyl-D-erythritol 4-phosphate cytidylyltransferase/2-C-methyl-D-erythritol 2,4-cyclodiphosphate synthase n=1 Tax=Pararhizobium haloflavum TaxID=2037914 RepID=UPI000C17B669|nr:bifunctional 2-C-methyl-D-erythritol 4-phosphate cytidylyltransferase/2-C-methyl-D-erythritol 2,4-cyclodiphosphate synthase [Pararhizobium haloflavum]